MPQSKLRAARLSLVLLGVALSGCANPLTDIPGVAQLIPGSGITKQGIVVDLVRDTSYQYIVIYRSKKFDFGSGTESADDDFGQVEFAADSNMPESADNGHFIYGRQYVSNRVSLGFIDKGAVDVSSVKEAPEFGYSAAPAGNRNKVKIAAGNTYIIRAQYGDTGKTYYGKIFIKDLMSDKVTFDYTWQNKAGSRAF